MEQKYEEKLLSIMQDMQEKGNEVEFARLHSYYGYALKDILGVFIKNIDKFNNVTNITNILNFIYNYIDDIYSHSDVRHDIPYPKDFKETLICIDIFLGSLSELEVTSSISVDDEARSKLQKLLIYYSRTNCINPSKIVEKRPDIWNKDNLSSLTERSLDYLKEGDLFGIRAIDLLPVIFCDYQDETSKKYSFYASSLINYAPEFQNAVLLLCYLGNNECIELYTQKIVNIDKNNDLSARDYSEYGCSIPLSPKSFAAVQTSPLVFPVDSDRKIFEVDDNFKEQFLSQEDKKSDIAAKINLMYEYYKEKNCQRIQELRDRDHEEALKFGSLEESIVKLKKVAQEKIDQNRE